MQSGRSSSAWFPRLHQRRSGGLHGGDYPGKTWPLNAPIGQEASCRPSRLGRNWQRLRQRYVFGHWHFFGAAAGVEVALVIFGCQPGV